MKGVGLAGSFDKSPSETSSNIARSSRPQSVIATSFIGGTSFDAVVSSSLPPPPPHPIKNRVSDAVAAMPIEELFCIVFDDVRLNNKN